MPIARVSVVASLVTATSILLTPSCSSKDAPAEDLPQPTLDSLQAKVFTPRCADAGCHGIDFPKQGVAFFNTQVTVSTTVNVRPSIGDAASNYPAIIVPGDPDRSFLIAKLTNLRQNEGLLMPSGRGALSPATIDVIRTWIASMPK
jgi:hypothetical protein